VIHQTLDGEVIVVNLDSGTYYSLEGPAAAIWSAIDGGASLAETVAHAARRYDAPGDALERSVTRFVDELEREQLIVAAEREGVPDAGANGANGANGAYPPEATPFSEPVLNKYTDMQELLLLDPIHEVDESGWPNSLYGGAKAAEG
jgi:Coenzyme PQQ synthesis protein D (PqqD)